MSTIPADLYAQVTPSVLSASGNAVDVIGLVLTQNTRVPIGTVESFAGTPEIDDFFGPASHQATFCSVYFKGYNGATAQPGSILYAQYPLNAVAAYLRGGDISTLPLATLQGYSGELAVTINGTPESASINLSAATSFSNAAAIIAEALGIEGTQTAQVTASLSGTVMTVSAVISGTIGVGDVVTGTGLTAGTYVASFGTGTGGDGTYNLSAAATTEAGETITAFAPAVVYDSVSGAFVVTSNTTGAASTITFGSGALATDLLLTQATGAVLSPGANATTPAAFMSTLTSITTDWVLFTTDFDPDGGSGNTQKQAFAAWNTAQDDSYVYVAWDTDITPTESVPATNSLGNILQQNGNSGTCPIYEPTDLNLAAFIMGAAASINFNAPNGRITFAFKNQAGIGASVTTGAAAINLGGNPLTPGSFGNGYNYYGAVGAANDNFLWFQRGTITGPFVWLDSYINQIVLNSAFQAALLSFLGSIGSVLYDAAGNSLIEQALAPVIQQFGNPATGGFGAFAPGTISASQISAVNNAAGSNIATTLQTQGYYLLISTASAAVRAARASPPMTFFYLDRGSVQALALASIAVE